jgi:hypothetical protein
MRECITGEASGHVIETAAKGEFDGHAERSALKLRNGAVRMARLTVTSLSNRPANERARRSILPQATRTSAGPVRNPPSTATSLYDWWEPALSTDAEMLICSLRV